MEYIRSKDNTPLAYERKGTGPSLVVVGGALADHHLYDSLANTLAAEFTVITYDRRNRGQSGNSLTHSVDTELEDLEVIMSLTESPVIYGHSAGGALAIRAAAMGFDLKALIVADLPFSPLNEASAAESEKFEKERLEIIRLLNTGDKTEAVKYFLKDFGMSQRELNEFVTSDQGRKAIECSSTLPVDYDILGNGLVPADLLRCIQIPTLVLTSKAGITVARDAAQYLMNGSVEVLETPVHDAATETARMINSFVKERK